MKLIALAVLIASSTCFAERQTWDCEAVSLIENIHSAYPVIDDFRVDTTIENSKVLIDDQYTKVTVSNDDTTIFATIKDKRANGYTLVKSEPLSKKSIYLYLSDSEKAGTSDIGPYVDVKCTNYK